jgi:enoyl-CoA hydratase/carnithine racemase
MRTEPPFVATELAGGVATVQLNRPETLNAMSPEMMVAIAEELERLDHDQGVRVIVLAGHDRAFAAGADLKLMRERSFQEAMAMPAARFWQRLGQVGLPMIAAVSGYALGGGCELALSCDLIVAAETARFGQPEIRVGILPGGGGTQRLTRIMGRQRAAELVLTGRQIDAAEARDLGFVNRVVAGGAWREAAAELAAEIAVRPPIAVRLAKRALTAAEEMPLSAGLSTERRLYELAMATEDRVEGMSAFLEKREPVWSGR